MVASLLPHENKSSDVPALASGQKPGKAGPDLWPGLGYGKAKAIGLSPGFCTLGRSLKFSVRDGIFSISAKVLTLKKMFKLSFKYDVALT